MILPGCSGWKQSLGQGIGKKELTVDKVGNENSGSVEEKKWRVFTFGPQLGRYVCRIYMTTNQHLSVV